MGSYNLLKIVAGAITAALVIVLVCVVYLCRKRGSRDEERGEFDRSEEGEEELRAEELIRFSGGEDLSIQEILDAPGEVIGKSSYGTLYRAVLPGSNSTVALRFFRPASTGKAGAAAEGFSTVVEMLGLVRHPNLVEMLGFYSGPRGEKLFVHPFVHGRNLKQFLTGGGEDSRKWPVIYRMSLGIVRALNHLHCGSRRPIIHGNLKSKNILLDRNYEPNVSDYGLHLLLNSTSSQEMLEASAAQGYNAPELIKMKDASKESDVYSLGIILLEIITGKEPINENPSPSTQDLYLPDSMRSAIIDHRIADMFHPDILLSKSNHPHQVTEEKLLKFVQLAMACCAPSPSLRPDIKQVLRKLEEIGS
ncbi:hypothetical protein Sjap_004465 [Stephania japonica]|uniref:Protein kinase domain-containing protein n=1 Tax=Stephania japonica TaxID=461633 RepID=A0AAP0PHV3_9MAGN